MLITYLIALQQPDKATARQSDLVGLLKIHHANSLALKYGMM
jgi:hypothetical protein